MPRIGVNMDTVVGYTQPETLYNNGDGASCPNMIRFSPKQEYEWLIFCKAGKGSMPGPWIYAYMFRADTPQEEVATMIESLKDILRMAGEWED